MSVYNGGKYLRETIDSVLTQSYANFEFIIVDDCSTDNTWDILCSYKDDRIKIFHNETNCKLAHNLNFAIDIAKGKYIARIDADDICLMSRFVRQVKFLEQHPGTDILGGQYLTLGVKEKLSDYPIQDADIKALMLFINPLCHPSVVFRSSIGIRYDESYATSQDYDLWVRSFDSLSFYNTNFPVLYYRIHDGQTVRKNGKSQNVNANKARARLLAKLGRFSDEEVLIFNKLCSCDSCGDKDVLLKYRKLLEKINCSNKSQRVFNEKSLNKAIKRIYFDNVMKLTRSKADVSYKELFRYNFYLLRNISKGLRFVLFKLNIL